MHALGQVLSMYALGQVLSRHALGQVLSRHARRLIRYGANYLNCLNLELTRDWIRKPNNCMGICCIVPQKY